jgi:hypothetical protein
VHVYNIVFESDWLDNHEVATVAANPPLRSMSSLVQHSDARRFLLQIRKGLPIRTAGHLQIL